MIRWVVNNIPRLAYVEEKTKVNCITTLLSKLLHCYWTYPVCIPKKFYYNSSKRTVFNFNNPKSMLVRTSGHVLNIQLEKNNTKW